MPTQAQVDARVSELTNVGILVHLAFRYDSVDEAQISTTIFKNMRQAYENELTRQAQALKCERVGRLGENQELSALRDISNQHAASIVRTFNYDLAGQIAAIRAETPTANRHYYTRRLIAWHDARVDWKNKQIALMTVQTATQRAREAFLQNNPVTGKAYFEPKQAAEEECQRLVAGNPHPVEAVHQNPTPIHINCPHGWRVVYDRIPKDGCGDLWMGA